MGLSKLHQKALKALTTATTTSVLICAPSCLTLISINTLNVGLSGRMFWFMYMKVNVYIWINFCLFEYRCKDIYFSLFILAYLIIFFVFTPSWIHFLYLKFFFKVLCCFYKSQSILNSSFFFTRSIKNDKKTHFS